MIQPTFVTHLPKELVPLAKLSPDDPTTVEVFELPAIETEASEHRGFSVKRGANWPLSGQ
jgi:lysyl-tRNA synthetase class II